MKRLRFLPALLLILSACSENIIEQNPLGTGEMGSVSIALSTDLRNEIVDTKAGEEPDVDDFWISIYKKETQTRLYSDSYANSKKEIKLNSGNYRLVAQCGDSLGCGFDKPYYMADPSFTVAGRNTQVNAVAKLANVKMAVVFDQTISEQYTEYCAMVKHQTYTAKQLRFNPTETRFGYMPGGEILFQFYAKVNGEWKYYQADPLTYNPNDFVTFTVTGDTSEGGLVINITVDRTVEDKNETIEIPAIAVPQGAPAITLAGFDGNNVHEFIEGVKAGANATASFIAKASLAHCYLTIESEYLASKGVPAQIDFAHLTSDQKAVLKAAGFVWDESMATTRNFSYIDFSGVIAKMIDNTKAAAEDVVMAEFTLKVEDSVAKTAETTFRIVSAAVKATLDVKDYNVWARKIVDPTFSINKGDMALLKLQMSTDNLNWTDASGTPEQNGYTYTLEKLAVNPAVTYYFRSIYNGNVATVSPTVTVTTEAAAQVGNPGFEEYQKVNTYDRNWYLPYNAGETDPWWACNSLASMKSSTTVGYKPYKNFPSSGYVTDAHSGSKAAMMFCVNIGNSNTDWSGIGTTYEGELWIGTSDDKGNRATEGHAFPSRPSKLNFWYKYDTMEGKTFFVDAWIKDASGNIIATAQDTAGQGASEWTLHSLDFSYTNLLVKAATIFIRFSASNGNGSFTIDKEFALGDETVSTHAGCFFTIDDIELIYE